MQAEYARGALTSGLVLGATLAIVVFTLAQTRIDILRFDEENSKAQADAENLTIRPGFYQENLEGRCICLRANRCGVRDMRRHAGTRGEGCGIARY